MATKYLTDWQWVSRATAKPDKYSSGVLECVHVAEDEIAATNRHILFIVPGKDTAHQLGNYNPKTLESNDSTYPNYHAVAAVDGKDSKGNKRERTHHVDVDELMAMAQANLAYCKSCGKSPAEVPLGIGDARVNAEYIVATLKGAYGDYGSYLEAFASISGPLEPLRFEFGKRLAIVMPVKSESPAKFDASHAIELIRKPVKVAV